MGTKKILSVRDSVVDPFTVQIFFSVYFLVPPFPRLFSFFVLIFQLSLFCGMTKYLSAKNPTGNEGEGEEEEEQEEKEERGRSYVGSADCMSGNGWKNGLITVAWIARGSSPKPPP